MPHSRVTRSPGSDRASRFAETSLSLLGKAQSGDAEALDELCSRYWHPLRTWALARNLVRSETDADDLVQDFFARMLRKSALARHDPGSGARFRTYLWTCLKRHAIDQWRKRSLPIAEEPPDTRSDWLGRQVPVTPEIFEDDRPWAERVLVRAREQLRHEWAVAGQAGAFEALEPMLEGERSEAGQQAVAARLGISNGNVRMRLHRMRARYRELIKKQVWADLPPDASDAEREEEMKRFREALRS